MRSTIFPRLIVLLAGGLMAGGAAAADLRPSWQCLPDDTALMVHVPQPVAFLDGLRSATKFGAVALEPKRMESLWKAMAATLPGLAASESTGDVEDRLGKYGLSTADVEAAFAGDMGMAVVARRRAGGLPPLVMVLQWLEPGAEAGQRMLTASQKMIEESADAASAAGLAAPKRVDLEMAGRSVTWVVQPVFAAVGLDFKIDGPVDAERIKELRKEFEEKAKKAERVRVAQTHSFLVQLDGRILAGQTVPLPAAGTMTLAVGGQGIQAEATPNRKPPAAPDEAELERQSGTDEARGLFETFLARHAEAGDAPLADILEVPGVRAVLPTGTTLADVVVQPRVVLSLLGGGLAPIVRPLGIDGIGAVAWRVAFDSGVLRQGMFAAAPAPRRGVLHVLDQNADPAEVPSFVTTEAIELTQISLDLGQAYATLREVAVAHGGERATNMFAAAEGQTLGWLGRELPAVLSALGSRHWIVSFPPQVAVALAEARKRTDGDADGGAGADRLAAVWQVADEEPFLKLLQRIAPLAQSEMAEEQGFRGVRIPNGPAAFVGHGHLVVAFGAESLEKTLAAIRNPPAGAAALRESDVVRRAAGMLEPAPSRAFSVGDASHTGGMLGTLRQVVAALEPDDVPEEYRPFLAAIQPLLPSAAEMEGMFGGSTSLFEMTDDGMSYRAAWELPAP